MNRRSKDVDPPAVSPEHERRNIHNCCVYAVYYLLDELRFLSDASYVKQAWRGEIEGVCTWPNDEYNDVYAFGEIDDAIDYFLPAYSLTAVFQNFSKFFNEMVFAPQFQDEDGFCNIEVYLASVSFHALVEAAQVLHADLCTRLTERGINIDQLRSEVIARS